MEGELGIKRFLLCIEVKNCCRTSCCCKLRIDTGIRLLSCIELVFVCWMLGFMIVDLVDSPTLAEEIVPMILIIFLILAIVPMLSIYGTCRCSLLCMKIYYYFKIFSSAIAFVWIIVTVSLSGSLEWMIETYRIVSNLLVLLIGLLIALYEAYLAFSYINLVAKQDPDFILFADSNSYISASS